MAGSQFAWVRTDVSAFSLRCMLCGSSLPDREATSCTSCGGVSVVAYDRLPDAPQPAADAQGLWRYRAWLPAPPDVEPVTLGEGATPLVHLGRWAARLGLETVYAKLEYVGPTGSFKDRGASVLLTHARAIGARRLIEDSSGNAGAAMAAYAARAGLNCTVYAPAATPASKLRQIVAYGAELIEAPGTRDDVALAAQTAGREPGAYYAGHNANPYFVEGTKTFAFELIEAFRGNPPDHIVIPVGGGSLLAGCALGFTQWRQAGICARIPRLHAVQPLACMPLVAAYRAGAEQPLPIERKQTVAGGITIEHPPRGSLILRALRQSGGSAIAVDDDEILQAQRDLARAEGIFCEPTSAAACAGLTRLVHEGQIAPGERVVLAITGGGLKDPDSTILWQS